MLSAKKLVELRPRRAISTAFRVVWFSVVDLESWLVSVERQWVFVHTL